MSAPLRLHEGEEPHFHEWSEEARRAAAETIWKADNVELTTVGIDIGSSTSHLMFARVHLQRKTQCLSSEFAVVSREILWRSPILLTPFCDDFTIDAARLRAFVEAAYRSAGVASAEVDSGAVILTGEALKRTNAQAIAQIFSAEAGKFVCASAGHHLEAALAAHGGGAVALSRATHRTVLNVDMGGGTTKFALVRNGELVATSAAAVGGRLLAWSAEGRLTRIEDAARKAARALGIELRLGQAVSDEGERVSAALGDVVISMLRYESLTGLAKELALTAPLPAEPAPHLVTFTGGVSEYFFGREQRSFGDIARPLAQGIARAFADGRVRVPVTDPGQGIRATVIGASQFCVQLSGNTIHLSPGVELPLRNVPVLFPALDLDREGCSAAALAAAVGQALERADADAMQPIALAIRWRGDPHYARLRALAEGIAQATGRSSPARAMPLVLIADRDVGRLLGQILERELRVPRGLVSIDGVQLREFDYVDIGELLRPANAVPVIIKSLLFPR